MTVPEAPVRSRDARIRERIARPPAIPAPTSGDPRESPGDDPPSRDELLAREGWRSRPKYPDSGYIPRLQAVPPEPQGDYLEVERERLRAAARDARIAEAERISRTPEGRIAFLLERLIPALERIAAELEASGRA